MNRTRYNWTVADLECPPHDSQRADCWFAIGYLIAAAVIYVAFFLLFLTGCSTNRPAPQFDPVTGIDFNEATLPLAATVDRTATSIKTLAIAADPSASDISTNQPGDPNGWSEVNCANFGYNCDCGKCCTDIFTIPVLLTNQPGIYTFIISQSPHLITATSTNWHRLCRFTGFYSNAFYVAGRMVPNAQQMFYKIEVGK